MWIKDNKLKSVAAVLAIITGSITVLDKVFDFWEEHIAKAQIENKRMVEKDSSMNFVLYKERATFDTDKKTGQGAR